MATLFEMEVPQGIGCGHGRAIFLVLRESGVVCLLRTQKCQFVIVLEGAATLLRGSFRDSSGFLLTFRAPFGALGVPSGLLRGYFGANTCPSNLSFSQFRFSQNDIADIISCSLESVSTA